MNPFTRSLLRRLNDRRLAEFVGYWDALEALLIRVYKGGQATVADETEHQHTRAWLLGHYPTWQLALAACWPRTRAADAPTKEDPFALLLAFASAANFVDNWPAMQTLPAAREALNLLLVERATTTDE